MARGADISMLGDKDLERMFRKLPAAMQDKALRPAVKAGAELARKEAIRRVPVDTGRLKAAMSAMRIRTRLNKGILVAGLPFPDRSDLGISPSDENFWPAAVEYGHAGPGGAARTGSGKRASGRRTKGVTKAVAPRPFLRPAIDENRERILRIIGASLS